MITNKTIREVVIADKLFPGGSGEPTYDTRTASGAIATFNTNVVKPLRSLTAQILPKQEGTGDPSPSNPRPISGTSVLDVTRTGKNFFDKSTSTAGAFLNNSGAPVSGTNHSYSDYIEIVPNKPYYFSNVVGSSAWFSSIVYDESKTVIGTKNVSGAGTASGSITFSAGSKFIRINYLTSNEDSVQIELGSTATTYEPYTGSTYPITLGRTVYGGSADVVEGTGEETHGIIDLGDLTWTYRTDVLSVPCFLSNDISNIKNGSLPIACSCFKIMSPNRTAINGNYQISIGNNTNAKYLVIRYDELTDGTAVKTALTGQKLVYELAIPTDFTFTGQEINSLEGVNNVWHDANGTTEVEYLYQTGEGGSKVNKWLPIFYPIRKENL